MVVARHDLASSTDSWSHGIDRAVDDCYPYLVELRRHLHRHPEPSGHEQQTTAHLAALVRELGYEPRFGPEERGLIVDARSESSTPRIGLRADIDALRIEDAKKTDYRSQVTGVMHACGHDAHPAIVLGAMRGLETASSEGALPWPVPWRAIFQPAEETNRGAREMIASGALDGVGAILATHLDPSRPVGEIGLRVGALTALCDEVKMTIIGRGGHAARPHESLDPIATAAQLISSLYLFVPRGVDSQDPVVLTFGQIVAGDNANVIPETVELRGTLRTLSERVRQRTKEHIERLAAGLAEAASTKIRVEYPEEMGSVVNDPEITELVHRAAADLVGEGRVVAIERPSMGGEDFAAYLDTVPGTMFRLGCVSETAGGAPLHSPLFDLDEAAIGVGAKLMARAAVLCANPARQTVRGAG